MMRLLEILLHAGTQLAAWRTLDIAIFHKRVCGPLAQTLFHGRPDKSAALRTPFETANYRADAAIQKLVDPLAA